MVLGIVLLVLFLGETCDYLPGQRSGWPLHGISKLDTPVSWPVWDQAASLGALHHNGNEIQEAMVRYHERRHCFRLRHPMCRALAKSDKLIIEWELALTPSMESMQHREEI